MTSIRSPQQLGSALRAARKQLGLTQPQLALAAGVGVRFIVDLEAGKPFAGQEHALAWLLDLGTHWQWVFLLGLVVFGALAAWLRDRRWLILLLALPLPWLRASPSAPAATHPAATLSILSANLNLDNPDAKALLAIVQQTRPDVVMLLELTPHYAAQLKAWADYPYQALEPEDSPFGMGMVSRVSLHSAQVILNQASRAAADLPADVMY
ncbi:MAG: endonuclease/exonuclease/phosphatase family protein [Halothiobacillaceae bacterium]